MKANNYSQSYRESEEINPEVLKMLESINGNKRTTLANEGYGGAAITSHKTISLSDTEFDKY